MLRFPPTMTDRDDRGFGKLPSGKPADPGTQSQLDGGSDTSSSGAPSADPKEAVANANDVRGRKLKKIDRRLRAELSELRQKRKKVKKKAISNRSGKNERNIMPKQRREYEEKVPKVESGTGSIPESDKMGAGLAPFSLSGFRLWGFLRRNVRLRSLWPCRGSSGIQSNCHCSFFFFLGACGEKNRGR